MQQTNLRVFLTKGVVEAAFSTVPLGSLVYQSYQLAKSSKDKSDNSNDLIVKWFNDHIEEML